MHIFKLSLLSVLMFVTSLAIAQVPVQKLNFPSTSLYGKTMDVTDDGLYLATISAKSNSAASDIFIYQLINDSYELVAKDRSNLEVDYLSFSSDNKTLYVGEGLGNIFRQLRIFTFSLTDEEEWVKNDPIITDFNSRDKQAGASVDRSWDNSTLAYSTPDTNHVYIYNISATNEATLMGEPLEGNQFYNYFGGAVSLSGDGTRLSVTTASPELTEVYELQNSAWDVIHTVEKFSGHTQLSTDGKSLMVSRGKEIQIFTETSNGTWEGSELIKLHQSGFRWNIISSEFHPEYGHLTCSMLNASNQDTKLATIDLIEGKWLERRSPFYDEIYNDYTGIETATSVDGSLVVTSSPRLNSKGEIYVYNDLQGSALGIAAFRDKNRNGLFDTGESYFTDCSFLVNDYLNLFALEGLNYASAYGPNHKLDVIYDHSKYLSTTGDSFIFDRADGISVHLFGIDYIEPQAKAQVTSCLSLMLCNTKDDGRLHLRNTGTEPIYAEIEINFEHLEFVSTTIQIVSETDSTVIISTPILQPGEKLNITNIYQLPEETFTGDLIPLHFSAKIYDADTDILSHTKEINSSFTLRCSYDPNDKAVIPDGVGTDKLTLKNQELTYRIRFQNTGNYPATNVVVKDVLNENLDLSTFKIIETSHELTQAISRNREVQFTFENIMLPDSINNEPESHGYIIYSIRPEANLNDYTEITNTANIYFDFNEAIITNTTLSTMVESLNTVSVHETVNDNNKSMVFPNPITKGFNLNLELEAQVQIYNSSGMQVLEEEKQSGVHWIETDNLATGAYWIKVSFSNSAPSEVHTLIKQ